MGGGQLRGRRRFRDFDESVQAVTADYYASTARGKAFGVLLATANAGGMLGALAGARAPCGRRGSP